MSPDNLSYKYYRQRLKQKFSESGVDAFHDYEVLELLLSYAIPRKDIKPLAKGLLQEFGFLKGIIDAEKISLEKIKGISSHTATPIKLIKDFGTLYLKEEANEKPQINCTSELLNYYKTLMGGLKEEQFCVIYLNAQNRITEIEAIEEGVVN